MSTFEVMKGYDQFSAKFTLIFFVFRSRKDMKTLNASSVPAPLKTPKKNFEVITPKDL